MFQNKVQFFDSYFKKKGSILSVRETQSVGFPYKCLSSINHETLGHNYTSILPRQKKCPPTNELMNYWRTFVHRKAHDACSNLHSALPCRLILCLSTNITSPSSEERPLTGCPLWSRCCHSSLSSVDSIKYLVPLLSRSGTPHVRLCV